MNNIVLMSVSTLEFALQCDIHTAQLITEPYTLHAEISSKLYTNLLFLSIQMSSTKSF